MSVRLTEEESEMLDFLVDHSRQSIGRDHPELVEHFNRSSALRHALRMWHAHVTTTQEGR